MDTITYRIKRFDGTKEWFQQYTFPYEKNKTLLWGLIKIRDEQDPTLNFTSACRHAICGSCGVRVNGNAVLACKTSLDELLEVYQTSVLTVEPLSNFPVVRDLVVDWDPKLERMKEVRPWLIVDEKKDCTRGFSQSEEEFHKISNPTDCILCGCCTSECTQHTTNSQGFYEPFIFTKSYRFTVDSRDGAPAQHLTPALEKGGLWKCVRCMQCITKCPKGVRPADHISGLRQESMNMGYTRNKGARHAYAFYDDVKNSGRLNEMTLPIKTEGFFNTLHRLPFALRLLKKGKINPLHIPKPVPGIEGVRKIYRLVRKGEAK
ncbi:4Fe-4S dicluster domain-containing protein [Thermanaerosceptrum fracticalcis]|uniref:Fumarate reductase iron-sulfur subunit n=1 Tax=Thermanaerosceptrum fracticalcis TaxID=1712410 RepID=A0A7G6E736_THEFR|nr:succinate dehydrogenase/fumarate reductase iron-sulfur subunit [Thermanaerosceptrum fracticalcis]QNB47890.1 4Fe-4S dicluster domain-containing protein [Thermanaerosceptrum fracticalcis]